MVINEAMVGAGTDQRLKGRARLADVVGDRCDALPPEDAALLRAVFVLGQPMTQVSRLTGRPLHQIRTRVRRLVRRVMSREYVLVVRARRGWTATRRSVGEACFLRGLSAKDAARELGLSPHRVRRHREAIVALAETANN